MTILCIVTLSLLSGQTEVLNKKAKADLIFIPQAYGNRYSAGKQSTPVPPQFHYSFTASPAVLQIKEIAVGQKIYIPVSTPTPTISPNSESPWGKSTQVDEHTWTIKVGIDNTMAKPLEILAALNSYRQRHGRGTLEWSDALGEFAAKRAGYFVQINKLDGHAGFLDFVNNQDGFKKLGFTGLGENSSIGYTLEAVHLIEWIYAGDKPHNDNQLSSDWKYIGIGVMNNSTDLVFGGDKL